MMVIGRADLKMKVIKNEARSLFPLRLKVALGGGAVLIYLLFPQPV